MNYLRAISLFRILGMSCHYDGKNKCLHVNEYGSLFVDSIGMVYQSHVQALCNLHNHGDYNTVPVHLGHVI